MKKFIFLILLTIPFYLFSQCPVEGNSPKHYSSDSLKNRSVPGTSAISVDISQFVCANNPNGCGSDLNKYSPNTYVALTGYVVLVKYGGSETCNCGSKNPADYDIHVEIAASPTEKSGKNIMVVEISRYTRGTMTLASIKTLLGKRVTVYGWLFQDMEHWFNSVNDQPKGTTLWRGSIWEVHPVFAIIPF